MTKDAFAGFILGLSIGVLLAVFNSEFNLLPKSRTLVLGGLPIPLNTSYDGYMHSGAELSRASSMDSDSKPLNVFHREHNHTHQVDELARQLFANVRVLCWVMTSPQTLWSRAKPVKDTWGKRCNILLFMSSVEDKKLPAVGLNVPEGRENLWLKTRAAWAHVYKNYIDKADWFVKVDDDSFLIVENLRYLLSAYDTNKPYYFGRHFKTFGGYNSGGAGYVFSKETLRQFNRLLSDPIKCRLQSFAEDMEVGKCLQSVGIHPTDSRDNRKRERFHPFQPVSHLIHGAIDKGNWIHQYNNYPVVNGPDCCSDFSVTFHYIDANQMYTMNFLIYHLAPYGISSSWETKTNSKTSSADLEETEAS